MYKPFKMKNPSMAKMAKQAGSGSPMKLDNTPAQQKLGKKAGKLKRTDIPTRKPTKITKKISKKYGLDDPRPRPPQPPTGGNVKGLTQFQYDTKGLVFGNKQLGKIRGKVKDYFFKK